MSLILTKAALALNCTENNVEVVKFVSHKPKKKVITPQTEDIKQNVNKNEIDIKKIRHEIVKFGMSGFDSKKKEQAKIALAVSLGAKPPRRQYINYKELMATRKEEKEKEKEEKEVMRMKTNVTAGIHKKKKALNDVGHLLSSYGKVQKKDLKKPSAKHPGKKETKRKTDKKR